MCPFLLGFTLGVAHGVVVMVSEMWNAKRNHINRINGGRFKDLAWGESFLVTSDR